MLLDSDNGCIECISIQYNYYGGYLYN